MNWFESKYVFNFEKRRAWIEISRELSSTVDSMYVIVLPTMLIHTVLQLIILLFAEDIIEQCDVIINMLIALWLSAFLPFMIGAVAQVSTYLKYRRIVKKNEYQPEYPITTIHVAAIHEDFHHPIVDYVYKWVVSNPDAVALNEYRLNTNRTDDIVHFREKYQNKYPELFI